MLAKTRRRCTFSCLTPIAPDIKEINCCALKVGSGVFTSKTVTIVLFTSKLFGTEV